MLTNLLSPSDTRALVFEYYSVGPEGLFCTESQSVRCRFARSALGGRLTGRTSGSEPENLGSTPGLSAIVLALL